jgi:hypothetical protein
MLAPVVPPAELERRWALAKKHLLRTLHERPLVKSQATR